MLVKITPLQANNEALFLLWLNLTCMMGIVGREGFQLLSVSVTDKQGDRTMERRSLAPSDCLVVKPTAGASNDKRKVSVISQKGHFRNWFKEKEGEWQRRRGGYIKKWKELVHFQQIGPSKKPHFVKLLVHLSLVFPSLHVPPHPHPTFNSLNCC